MTAKVSWLRRTDSRLQSAVDRFVHTVARLFATPTQYVTAALVGAFVLLYASAAFLPRSGPRFIQWFVLGFSFVWFALLSISASVPDKNPSAAARMNASAKPWLVIFGTIQYLLDMLLFVIGPPSTGYLAMPLGRFMAMQTLSAGADILLVVIGYAYMTPPLEAEKDRAA